jgi:hypothetical protein
MYAHKMHSVSPLMQAAPNGTGTAIPAWNAVVTGSSTLTTFATWYPPSAKPTTTPTDNALLASMDTASTETADAISPTLSARHLTPMVASPATTALRYIRRHVSPWTRSPTLPYIMLNAAPRNWRSSEPTEESHNDSINY